MRFEDFTLQIRYEPAAARHPVALLSSPAGEAQGWIEPAPEWLRLIDQALPPTKKPEARQIGEQLFARLFTGDLRSRYDFCCGRLAGLREGGNVAPPGMRIGLRLQPGNSGALALARLPWELLWYEPDQGFLGLQRDRSITRSIELPQPGPPSPFSLPLRVLVLLARPHCAPELDISEELASLKEALQVRDEVHVTVVEAATVPEIQRALAQRRYHVVHFAGHGTVDHLLLEDDSGDIRRLPGEQFARLLQEPHRPSLIFLNACSTGRLDLDGPGASGLPLALLQAGIPAVLAMQFPIYDDTAICFAARVYQALAHGAGLDAAVSEGRLHVHLEEPSSLEWAAPVLYLRDGCGGLFDLSPIGPILVSSQEQPPPLPAGATKKLHVCQRDLYKNLDDLRIAHVDDYRRLNEAERALLSREILDRITGLGTRPEELLEIQHVNTRFPSQTFDRTEVRTALEVLHRKSALYSDHSLACFPPVTVPGPYDPAERFPVLGEDVISLLLQHRVLVESGRMSIVPDRVQIRDELFRCLFDVQSLRTVKVDLATPEARTFFLDDGELFRPSGALVIDSPEGGNLPLPMLLEIEERYHSEYRSFQRRLKRSLLEMNPEGEAAALQKALMEVDDGIRELDDKFEQHRQKLTEVRSLNSGALAIVLYSASTEADSFLTSALASSSLGRQVSFVPDLRELPHDIRRSPYFVPWLISREARRL